MFSPSCRRQLTDSLTDVAWDLISHYCRCWCWCAIEWRNIGFSRMERDQPQPFASPMTPNPRCQAALSLPPSSTHRGAANVLAAEAVIGRFSSIPCFGGRGIHRHFVILTADCRLQCNNIQILNAGTRLGRRPCPHGPYGTHADGASKE